jgi:hypothetical protein
VGRRVTQRGGAVGGVHEDIVAADLFHELAERLELRGEVVVAPLVGGGEVRHQPDGVLARGEPQRMLAVPRAEPPHAGVKLDVDARGGIGHLVAPGHDVRVGFDRGAQLAARKRAHHEQAGVDAESTELGRLGRRRHRQPLRATGQRRLPDRTRTVAIRVRLDDRTQGLRKPRAVALDSA